MKENAKTLFNTYGTLCSIIFIAAIVCSLINVNRKNPFASMDEFDCAVYILNETCDAVTEAVSEKDLNDAFKKTIGIMGETFKVGKSINKDIQNDGLYDVIPGISEFGTDSSEEIGNYNWITDYNLDGVKDIYDYKN